MIDIKWNMKSTGYVAVDIDYKQITIVQVYNITQEDLYRMAHSSNIIHRRVGLFKYERF